MEEKFDNVALLPVINEKCDITSGHFKLNIVL